MEGIGGNLAARQIDLGLTATPNLAVVGLVSVGTLVVPLVVVSWSGAIAPGWAGRPLYAAMSCAGPVNRFRRGLMLFLARLSSFVHPVSWVGWKISMVCC